MLPVHVISFPRCVARRESAARQLATRRIPFEFFDAMESHEGKALFRRCDVDAFVINTGRKPVDGELGCFASHKALWQASIERNEPILIMEDDFRLGESFGEAVTTARRLINHVGILRLQNARRARTTGIAKINQFSLERYTKPPNGAMSYVIAPWLARRLVQRSAAFVAPVDVVLRDTWLFGQPMYCLKPYTVTDSEHCTRSVIGQRRKCRKMPATRLRRHVSKSRAFLRLQYFNLTHSDDRLHDRVVGQAASRSPLHCNSYQETCRLGGVGANRERPGGT